ncbi:prolyl oligopeptidase family serine peptidase [Flavisericum labens]|uniref:prolyl oligopeptidase family serine peptidase n=1 Tax=Flavisericum labens TaxID=3377112 RepID=UPI00387B7F89
MNKVFIVFLLAIPCLIKSQNVTKPELLPQHVVVDTYHGVELEDPYRYVENLDDPKVLSWMRDNANYANSVLNSISGKQKIFDKMKELVERRAASVSNLQITDDNMYYYLKRVPGEEISKMYKRNGFEGTETLFFDPTKYQAEAGKTYTIASITPNILGDKIAVSVAPNGSENPELLLFKSTGEQYDEVLDLARAISWRADGESFYYNKLNSPNVSDMNRKIYTSVFVHNVGQEQSEDQVVFSKSNYENLGIKEMEIPYVLYSKDADADFLYASSVDKDMKLFMNAGKGELKNWQLVLGRDDDVIKSSATSTQIYYLTYKNAPNYKIVRAPIEVPAFSNAKIVVEESASEIITGFSVTKDGLYYTTVNNGVEAKVYYLEEGKSKAKELNLPFAAGEASVSSKGSEFGEVWVSISGWTSPGKRFLYDPEENAFTHQQMSSFVEYPELNNLIAKEVEVKSHDGVMVPVSIIYNKDLKLNGENPAVIYSYGSYGNSTSPFFSPITLAYTLYNGILVVPHIRGGGELGDAWHKAGQKLNKPNTWKDAIATAEYLVKEEYSNPNKISIFGGSAGGILVGRSITERPDLFVAAAPLVGAMNTVRMEETPNGPVNIPEFGTVKDYDEFKGLLAMDSYHNLKLGTDYPATLITAGMNDPRVIAWQPAKFAAKMQHDNNGDSPILFLTNFEGGHGGRTTLTQALNDFANVFSFFYWQSGHPDFKLKKSVKD